MSGEAGVKLAIRNLNHNFGSFRALNDVSLDIKDGEFVCILGASGCGKSTLFNAVSGLLTISAGQILLDGKNIAGKPGQVGYMLQKDLLLPWRTVLGNITLGASLTRGAHKADREKAAELAYHYGLGDFLRHYPRSLSGGMRQRVALMRTIAAGRELMLLDEPFGALDSQTRIGMQQWLLEIWREMKRTVMFVTHDVDEAIFLADRVVVMLPKPGRIGWILDIEIPRPRAMDCMTSPAFVEIKRQVMEMLYSQATLHGVPGAQPGGLKVPA
ncbi:ABC transporter ATP-binding protein [Acidisoma cellulosilytica]|uniref:ABC transporter ATP-binding protein n=1 Tax=Acidisoma cellulosilyticum TaxID=2802395 RepID=A0A964E6R3_9PROT|nr:ABC transporter ATP-binding protein [Acidisoma cellulosilyticum]MCB8883846.1 ABC transporter ATP-binding protein [Acidisoma cellulosilyticum]